MSGPQVSAMNVTRRLMDEVLRPRRWWGWTERGALPWEIPDGPSELECAANESKGDKDVEEE